MGRRKSIRGWKMAAILGIAVMLFGCGVQDETGEQRTAEEVTTVEQMAVVEDAAAEETSAEQTAAVEGAVSEETSAEQIAAVEVAVAEGASVEQQATEKVAEKSRPEENTEYELLVEAAKAQQKAIQLKRLEEAARAQQIAIETAIVEEEKMTMVALEEANCYVDAGVTGEVIATLEEGDEIKVVARTRNGYYLTKNDTYILMEQFEKKVIPPPTPAPARTGEANISNTYSWAAIEADVVLNGSGTGYHAKLVICTPTSAVSFGIQYDTCARGNYKNRAMCMVENIGSNAKGGQSYFWPGDQEVGLNATAHLMITLNSDGSGNVYLNGSEIGSFYNGNMAYQTVYLRVEGSGRKEGDSVSAVFSNIRLRNSGVYDPGKSWGSKEFRTNSNIYAYRSGDYVSISGSVSGIGKADWDSAYNSVSSIIQFIE